MATHVPIKIVDVPRTHFGLCPLIGAWWDRGIYLVCMRQIRHFVMTVYFTRLSLIGNTVIFFWTDCNIIDWTLSPSEVTTHIVFFFFLIQTDWNNKCKLFPTKLNREWHTKINKYKCKWAALYTCNKVKLNVSVHIYEEGISKLVTRSIGSFSLNAIIIWEPHERIRLQNQ